RPRRRAAAGQPGGCRASRRALGVPPAGQPGVVPVRLRPLRRPRRPPARRAQAGVALPGAERAGGGQDLIRRPPGGLGPRDDARRAGRAAGGQRREPAEHDDGGGRLRPGAARPGGLPAGGDGHSLLLRSSMSAFQQQQFLEVIDRDEAERRFRAALDLAPLEAESVPLAEALGRVLAEDVVAPLDVPSFDRSNVDGFAVQARDTFGASEDSPRSLSPNDETLATGVAPRLAVRPRTATAIATGAMPPRGADAGVRTQ